MMSQSTFFVLLLVVVPIIVLVQQDFVHSFSTSTIVTRVNNNQKCLIQTQQPRHTLQLQVVSNDNNNHNKDSIVHSSRQEFLSKMMIGTVGMILTTTLSNVESASAADDKAVGTKKDPVYETCLSQCMYDCTKPKGYEQKSRSECLPECKKSCAKTPAQLLLGTPIKK